MDFTSSQERSFFNFSRQRNSTRFNNSYSEMLFTLETIVYWSFAKRDSSTYNNFCSCCVSWFLYRSFVLRMGRARIISLKFFACNLRKTFKTDEIESNQKSENLGTRRFTFKWFSRWWRSLEWEWKIDGKKTCEIIILHFCCVVIIFVLLVNLCHSEFQQFEISFPEFSLFRLCCESFCNYNLHLAFFSLFLYIVIIVIIVWRMTVRELQKAFNNNTEIIGQL